MTEKDTITLNLDAGVMQKWYDSMTERVDEVIEMRDYARKREVRWVVWLMLSVVIGFFCDIKGYEWQSVVMTITMIISIFGALEWKHRLDLLQGNMHGLAKGQQVLLSYGKPETKTK